MKASHPRLLNPVMRGGWNWPEETHQMVHVRSGTSGSEAAQIPRALLWLHHPDATILPEAEMMLQLLQPRIGCTHAFLFNGATALVVLTAFPSLKSPPKLLPTEREVPYSRTLIFLTRWKYLAFFIIFSFPDTIHRQHFFSW